MSADNQMWAALDSQNERLVEQTHPLLLTRAVAAHKPRRGWRARVARQAAQQPRHASRRGSR